MKRTISIILAFIVIFIFINCGNEVKQNANPEYVNEINEWHQKRIENLKKDRGWLNLVGLFWLKEGENTFGSAKSNDIVFPENASKKIGSFYLSDSVVTVKVNSRVNVMYDSIKVDSMQLHTDISGKEETLAHNSLRWYIIKRGDKYGIRLRDLDAPLVKNFEGIERFPVDTNWRITGTFERFDVPKVVEIPNILGSVEEDTVLGEIVFTKDGKDYSIIPIDAGSKFFIIFADETSGEETYGAGRFLYTEKPDSSSNKVILDFNKSYNPPCVFTKYATCPLPPKENHLQLRITAGEKNYGIH